MSVFQRLKYLHLAYLSKPSGRRQVYRIVKRRRYQSILQLGLGDADFSKRLIKTASMVVGDATKVSFAGIDLFEARPSDGEPLSIKAAHQILTRSGAQIKLVPGDPYEALARTANSMMGTDLVIIAANVARQMSRAWFYLPRVLHDGSLVFQEQAVENAEEEPVFQLVDHAEIRRRAGQASEFASANRAA